MAEDGLDVVGFADEHVADAGGVLEVVVSWETHLAAPAFGLAGGDLLGAVMVRTTVNVLLRNGGTTYYCQFDAQAIDTCFSSPGIP